MNRRRLALALPLLFAAHNLEEAATLAAFVPQVQARLKGAGLEWLVLPTYPDYLLALLLVTVAGAGIGGWVYRRPRSPEAIWALLLLQAVLLLNVFFHLAFAAVVRGYAPGLGTAVLLNLPVSLYVFRYAVRERWVSRAAQLALLPCAVIVHGPLLVGLLALVAAGTA